MRNFSCDEKLSRTTRQPFIHRLFLGRESFCSSGFIEKKKTRSDAIKLSSFESSSWQRLWRVVFSPWKFVFALSSRNKSHKENPWIDWRWLTIYSASALLFVPLGSAGDFSRSNFRSTFTGKYLRQNCDDNRVNVRTLGLTSMTKRSEKCERRARETKIQTKNNARINFRSHLFHFH